MDYFCILSKDMYIERDVNISNFKYVIQVSAFRPMGLLLVMKIQHYIDSTINVLYLIDTGYISSLKNIRDICDRSKKALLFVMSSQYSKSMVWLLSPTMFE